MPSMFRDIGRFTLRAEGNPDPETRLRVLHITDVFDSSIGGIETALSTLLPRMPSVDATVLVDGPVETTRFVGNPRTSIEVRHISPSDAAWFRLSFPLISMIQTAGTQGVVGLLSNLARQDVRTRYVRDEEGRVLVHYHGLGWLRRYNPAIPGMRGLLNKFVLNRVFRPSRAARASLYTDHSLFSGTYERFLRNGGAAIISSLAAVVTVERSGYENARRCLKEEKLHASARFIPNPIDTDLFRFIQPPSSPEFVLCYVGRAGKPGINTVAAIWEGAPPWARLVLCLATVPGANPTLGSISHLASHPRVSTFWNLPPQEVATVLGQANVLLDPYEVGTPRTTLEALATGRPVLRIRDSEEANEATLPSDLAPFVDRASPKSAWEVLGRFRDSPDTYVRLCHRCRDFAVSNFDVRVVANAYLSMYEDLCQGT